MWFHKHLPEARFANWAFGCLTVLFVAIATQKPAVGLSGLGGVMLLAALLVEANKDRIWQSYRDHYRSGQHRNLPKGWTEPSRLYYQLNVYVVWPLVFAVGLLAIYVAYSLG